MAQRKPRSPRPPNRAAPTKQTATKKTAAKKRARPAAKDERVGVWIFGALGGLATTMMVGARAIARGHVGGQGLLTETELTDGIPMAPMDGLVFGGHEVRGGTLRDAALEIYEQTGTIPFPLLLEMEPDLAQITKDIRPGCLTNAGRGIERLTKASKRRAGQQPRPLRQEVQRIQRDIRAFLRKHDLKRCVCVNLTSTEPKLNLTRTHRELERFEAAIDADRRSVIRPSALYAYAAASLGLPFLHFTPSNAALIPAIRECFERSGAPYMGADGKTGETLVKSSLAPMFKYRNLQVLSWQGYNILGDRDGVVLADADNKQAKVESKDALLSSILGYPLHTHVGIDYVPSLNDLKTAWDFIHFQGFLGYKMSMQFTWQGCDAILAAPIVLDMIRFADLAARRGEHGSMPHLSCYFKRPLDVDEHDMHLQWHLLTEYLERVRADPSGER